MKAKQNKKNEETSGLKKLGIIFLLLALVGLYVVLPIMTASLS